MKPLMPSIRTFDEFNQEKLATMVPRKALASPMSFRIWCLDNFNSTFFRGGAKILSAAKQEFPNGATFGEMLRFFDQADTERQEATIVPKKLCHDPYFPSALRRWLSDHLHHPPSPGDHRLLALRRKFLKPTLADLLRDLGFDNQI